MIPHDLLQPLVDETKQLWWVVPRALIVVVGIMYLFDRAINAGTDDD